MTRLKWFLSVVALLLLVAALIFWERRAGKEVVSGAAPASVPGGPAASPLVQAFRAQPPVQRVKDFYQEESRRVGAIDPDPAGTEKRLRDVAAELRPEEVAWLKAISLDTSKPGDGRFFATYMLALGSDPAEVGALGEIALTKVPELKNPGAADLERQIRAQAIEGLGHARASKEAQDDLLDVISNSDDEFLRDRAHRSLYAWQTGHPVEEQDKDAMGKMLYRKEK